MKVFFWKKYCFAALFLAFTFLFSAANLYFNRHNIKWLGEEAAKVNDVEALKSWVKDAESTTGSEIIGKIGFIESYGAVQSLLGKREFNGFEFIKDTDGMLYYGALAESQYEEFEEYAKRVRRMKEAAEANGAKFVVVIPPSKVLYDISPVNREWPINNPNARTDKFMNQMMKNGVFAVDMRPAMYKSERGLEELFFKTDHHWTPLAAFYATQELVKVIEEEYGDDWDPEDYYTNLDNYQTEFYTQCMLGSTGRNAGVAYSGMDDYLLLWPECDMKFTWTDYMHDRERYGTFRESLFDEKAMVVDDLYNGSFNMVYLDEVVTHDKIVNHSNPDGPKLTVVRDSYFAPMACFLAPMCSEIEMVWGRAKHNDMDFEKFVEESDADYVILEIYPYNLDDDSFHFYETSGISETAEQQEAEDGK